MIAEGTIPVVGDEYPTMISSPGIYEDTKEKEPFPFAAYTPSWVLNINGQPTDNFVPLPTYNPSNSYTFQITAPAGPLTFNVCDDNYSDNTGQYNITVTQN